MMAHQDYLGTFGEGQFKRYVAWATTQLEQITAKIHHLDAEIYRIGKVVLSYDRGVPTGLTADPDTSYMAKLLACYEIRGGNPFIDLRTRDISNPVFLERGDEAVAAHSMSNGEPVPGKGLADRESAEAMRALRSWLDTTLDRRYGKIERKIRRALDYQDQLRQEIRDLQTIQAEWQDRVTTVQQLLDDPGYRAVTKDQDPLGILSYAPYSSYDIPSTPNQDTTREAVMPQRQQGGIVTPGQTSK